jgi:hypothetical protein
LLFSFLHGPVRSTVPHGPRSGPVRSTGRHGTGRHGPFSDEGRTDPPLDRTVIGHSPVHGPATVRSTVTVRSGTGRTVRSISILYLTPSIFYRSFIYWQCLFGHSLGFDGVFFCINKLWITYFMFRVTCVYLLCSVSIT